MPLKCGSTFERTPFVISKALAEARGGDPRWLAGTPRVTSARVGAGTLLLRRPTRRLLGHLRHPARLSDPPLRIRRRHSPQPAARHGGATPAPRDPDRTAPRPVVC